MKPLTLNVFLLLIYHHVVFAQTSLPITTEQQKVLVRSDLDNLLKIFPVDRAKTFDKKNGLILTKLFGGTEGKNIKKFINDRITEYIFLGDTFSFSPSKLPLLWDIPNITQTNTSHFVDYSFVGENISITTWIIGAINNQFITINVNGNLKTLSSSRPGVLLLGPGYSDKIPITGGEMNLPYLYRIGKLIHESRHSDCSGGILKNDALFAQTASSIEIYFSSFESKKCGYLHTSNCISTDHDLTGQHACENEPWGPYSMEAVFFRAMKTSLDPSSLEWRQLDLYERDAIRRLNFDFESLLSGKLGEPDLSSYNQIVN